MTYHISKTVNSGFTETVEVVKSKLDEHGFGILSEIDVSHKLHEKLGVTFRNYLILGACNPRYAFQALQAEPHIGTMLPCNVVVQEWDNGKVEVSAIDPKAAMMAVNNPDLVNTATDIQAKLKSVIEAL